MSQRRPVVLVICISVIALLLSINELRSTFAAIGTNNPPVAVNDSYTIHNQLLLSLIQNDYDPDNGTTLAPALSLLNRNTGPCPTTALEGTPIALHTGTLGAIASLTRLATVMGLKRQQLLT